MATIPTRTLARAGYATSYTAPASKPIRRRRNEPTTSQSQSQPQSKVKYSGKVQRQIKDAISALEAAQKRLDDKEKNLARLIKEGATSKRIKAARDKVKKYRRRVKEYSRDLERVKQGKPTAAQTRNYQKKYAGGSRSFQTTKDGGRVEIVRRSPTEGGTYAIYTPKGGNLPTEMRGGSNIAEQDENRLYQTQKVYLREAQARGVSTEQLQKEVDAYNVEQERKYKIAKREQEYNIAQEFASEYKTEQARQALLERSAKIGDANIQAISSFDIEAIQEYRAKRKEIDAQNNIRLENDDEIAIFKWQRYTNPYLSKYDKFGGEDGFLMPVLDKRFFTKEGQAQAKRRFKDFSPVAEGAMSTTLRTWSNWILPKSLEFKDKNPSNLTYDEATGAEKILLNPIEVGLAGTPLVAKAVVLAAGGYKTIDAGGEKIQDIRFGTGDWRQNNPELYSGAVQAGYAALDEKSMSSGNIGQMGVATVGGSGLSYIFSPEASWTQGTQTSPQAVVVRTFTEGATDFLFEQGLSASEVEEARQDLAAKGARIIPSQFVGVSVAEVGGNIGGVPLSRTATNVFRRGLAREAAETATDRQTLQAIKGGFTEGTTAALYFELEQERSVSLTRAAPIGAIGALTAGVFEWGRTSTSLPKTVKSSFNVGGYAIEPQEGLIDVLQSRIERIGTRSTRTASRRVRSRTVLPAAQTSFNQFATGSPARDWSFTQSSSQSSSQTGTNVLTSSQSLTTSKSQSLATTNVLTLSTATTTSLTSSLVKTDALATTKAESTSKALTRAITTPIPPIVPFGGGGGGFGRRGRRKKPRQGAPSSITAQIFDFGLPKNLKTSKVSRSSIGFASGLGLRL